MEATSVEYGNERPIEPPVPTAVLRRFAFFMDGMSRAVLLPFGPALLYRLVYGKSEPELSHWSSVAYYLSMLVSVYILGRWMGTSMAYRFKIRPDPKKLTIHVARIGGALVSFHIFTYCVGLSWVRLLLFIRFFSACLAGLLCGITRSIKLPQDCTHCTAISSLDGEIAEATKQREGYVDITSGTAKIYLTGFAVSILSGGLLFRKATNDDSFQTLTGEHEYGWSMLFLIVLGVVSEIALRKFFAVVARRTTLRTTSAEDLRDLQNGATPFPEKISFSRSASFHETIVEVDENSPDGYFMDPLSVRSDHKSLQLEPFVSPVRSRTDSHASVDVEDFFDCRSVLSDNSTLLGRGSPLFSTNEKEVAQYVDGRCVYPDGSPAFVPQGDCMGIVPTSFSKFYNHDQSRAETAWLATQKWRMEKKVWKIHTIANPWFSRIKEAYPHFVHGHSKAGYPIVYEQPGNMNLKELFRNGCDISDMVRHYTFFMEFISNRICTRADVRAKMGPDAPTHCSSSWGIMVVMDVKGAGLSHLSGDVIKYLKQAGDVNSYHYPLTMKRAFLVNSPFWLAGAWSGIKGILPASVQVDILSESKCLAALHEYVDDDQIPPQYGGSSPYDLGEHPYEVELRQLVEAAKEGSEDEEECTHEKRPEAQKTFSPVPLPSTVATPPNCQPVRRRLASVDRVRRLSYSKGLDLYNADKTGGGGKDVFVLASVTHCLWSAIQGAIEAAIPLWILSPTQVGGLGYSPLRSGMSMFGSCLLLLAVFRTKSSRLISRIPSRAPLRALRIGAGSESFLFWLLVYVTNSSNASIRANSAFVMASTILIFACIALASMLGRSASKILHRISAESYARQVKPQATFCTKYYSMVRFVSDCETGRFTAGLSMLFEMFGSLVFAIIWSWSVSKDSPFNGTSIFFASSLATLFLYVCSFLLHLNSAGDFALQSKDSRSDSSVRRCIRFVGQVIAVSAGDVALLFEEAYDWSSKKRSRTFSGSSDRADLMERGGGTPLRSKNF